MVMHRTVFKPVNWRMGVTPDAPRLTHHALSKSHRQNAHHEHATCSLTLRSDSILTLSRICTLVTARPSTREMAARVSLRVPLTP